MANKRQKKTPKQKTPVPAAEPWIEKKTGLGIILALSIGMAVFVIWQLFPVIGWESVLWGLGFGAAIWGVFAITYYFNVWIRGRR